MFNVVSISLSFSYALSCYCSIIPLEILRETAITFGVVMIPIGPFHSYYGFVLIVSGVVILCHVMDIYATNL